MFSATTHSWVVAALRGSELVFVGNLLLWLVEALLLTATVILYELVLRTEIGKEPAIRKVMITARLGLFTSVGAFLIALMVSLALIDRLLDESLRFVAYEPWHFVSARPGAFPSAADYLHARMESSAASFAFVAAFLLALVGFLILTFAPSVFRELRLTEDPNSRLLGNWLTSGYEALDRFVRVWGLPTGLATLAIAVLLGLSEFNRITGRHVTINGVSGVEMLSEHLSHVTLRRVVGVIAGVTGGLLALGKFTLRQLKAIRMPLDAAIDVDNHFREFPRNAISRVLIMERYVALLEHIQAGNYQRLVIVAHSQGTVITADLLRYVHWAKSGRLQSISAWLQQKPIDLLTMGCPLRQLYAQRFPKTYSWAVSALEDAHFGPSPAQLHVRNWWNLWGSGDYVGRWLWVTQFEDSKNKCELARYDQGVHRQGVDGPSKWLDRCIGADAHTHYLDLDQRVTAGHLCALVIDKPAPGGALPASKSTPARV